MPGTPMSAGRWPYDDGEDGRQRPGPPDGASTHPHAMHRSLAGPVDPVACSLAGRFAVVLLDALFPQNCVLCDEGGTPLCDRCADDAVAPITSGCVRCAVPLPAGPDRWVCGRCLRRKPAFDGTVAAAAYAPPFDQLVRGLKYGATLAYAPLFAELVTRRLACERATARIPVDLVVPVPLSRVRIAERGFNQAVEIGRFVASRLGVPMVADAVLRIHDTAPQASLPFDARRRNVRGAFAVIDAGQTLLAGRHVGVVDDVMTTGATLDALASVIKRAGASSVVNLVVARTP